MRNTIEAAMNTLVNILFSSALFNEMITLVSSAPFHPMSIILLITLAGCVALTVVFQSRNSKKMSVYWNELRQIMLKENQFGQAYNVSGVDNRIYRYEDNIKKLFEKYNKDHLKA